MKQGVEEYIKKETKLEDFDIQVELIKNITNLPEQSDHEKLLHQIKEEFDDVLYDMNIQVRAKASALAAPLVVVVNGDMSANGIVGGVA